ncbi:MAG: hypothetical protein RL757_1461 [Bacteroidota bacterium]
MTGTSYAQSLDYDLILRYQQQHDVRCVGELFARYRHLVFGVCMKYLKNSSDSEDAVMEIFEKLHLDLKRSEIQHFKSWLYRVATNHCLMRLRKAGLKLDFPEEMPQVASETLAFLSEKENLLRLLEKNIVELKPEQRLCIELFFLQEKSYKQISDETGFTLGEIKSFIQNGKLNLKKRLTNSTDFKDLEHLLTLLWLFSMLDS